MIDSDSINNNGKVTANDTDTMTLCIHDFHYFFLVSTRGKLSSIQIQFKYKKIDRENSEVFLSIYIFSV